MNKLTTFSIIMITITFLICVFCQAIVLSRDIVTRKFADTLRIKQVEIYEDPVERIVTAITRLTGAVNRLSRVLESKDRNGMIK